MKRLFIICMAILSVQAVLKAQDEVFEKLADIKGVSVVYISKSMLRMMPDVKTKGVNIGSVAGKLNSITIMSGESASASNSIRKEMNALLKKDAYEQIMLVKDDDSKTSFYLKEGGANKNEILMVSDDGGEMSLIRISGDVTAKDIQSITSPKNPVAPRNTGTKKSREQTLKEAEAIKKEALKQREAALKERERALKEAEQARIEGQKALEEARKQVEEARKLIEQQNEDAKKNTKNK